MRPTSGDHSSGPSNDDISRHNLTYRLSYRCSFRQIRLPRVPAHCGLPGNERADELAEGSAVSHRMAPVDVWTRHQSSRPRRLEGLAGAMAGQPLPADYENPIPRPVLSEERDDVVNVHQLRAGLLHRLQGRSAVIPCWRSDLCFSPDFVIFMCQSHVLKPFSLLEVNHTRLSLLKGIVHLQHGVLNWDCHLVACVKLPLNLRPAGGGGCLNTPCGFSRIARKRRRAAPQGFHLPYPPSFWQLLWKFRSWVMQGQVTRSDQVTIPYKNFTIAPQLQCLRESYETFGIW